MRPWGTLPFSFLVVAVAACASSNVGGSSVDADPSSDGDATVASEDGSTEPDSSTPDDGAAIDAPAIDASAIDASAIDAVAIDAPAIDASTCPTAPCDLHQQCGCTAPLVCDIDFTDLVGTSCRAVNQAGTEGSTCFSGNPATAQSSYCAGGHVCVGSGNQATCEKYCDASSDCGQPRGQCVIQLTNGSAPIAGATVCSSNCNPVNSAAGGCPSGWKCAFFTVNNALTGNQDRDIVDCTVAGAGTQGAACTTDASCAADFLCSTVGTATACRRVCNLTTGGNECAAIPGTTCGGFNPALVVGGATYGICR